MKYIYIFCINVFLWLFRDVMKVYVFANNFSKSWNDIKQMLFFLVCLEWDDGITKEEAAFTKMLSGWLRTYFTVTVPFIMCYNVLQKTVLRWMMCSLWDVIYKEKQPWRTKIKDTTFITIWNALSLIMFVYHTS